MLYTKCILAPILPEDGIRISVMSRHTLEDGITPDIRITERLYHEWDRKLAPRARLVGAYYRHEINFEEYTNQYLLYLRSEQVRFDVQHLAHRALAEDITLLCIEETPEFCHRRLLAEECMRLESGLYVFCR